ncbi:MAG: hypothetical protein GYA24_21805 [Candidatus Lokiarchaeota archaeon]|nr:hypothetical protein [Candidatus Lokiarchaeota archaeon]
MKTPLRVHVIPVGDDPVGRIVNPAITGRADKVYFLRFQGHDLFQDVYDAARDLLAKKLSLGNDGIKDLTCDFYDVTSLVKVHARICKDEITRYENHVLINVSTGGKLNSIAGMLSAMLFGAEPYFCKMDFEQHDVPPVPDILGFPRYAIPRPAMEQVRFLFHLNEEAGRRKSGKVAKGDCIEFLEIRMRDPDFLPEFKATTLYNRLKFRFLDKLEREGLIAVEPAKRGSVSITPEGHFALDVFSVFYDVH